ncbi:MAG TPA: alpha-amylase family glycosyl hydrolase [Acidimicrobiales bacterium]|nr:alpha-amylase family glycosyl hydrolase [Acidimicrobiales bacterium]
MTHSEVPWWQAGVLYQIYPRSFADSNGDGNGDLRGIVDHLDHLAWLGVDGIWLSPITASPNADWGYDVSDFCAVEPDFGTMDDVDALLAAAAERGIRVLMDLVPNHTSDQHPWFLDSRRAREAARRDWYVWADPKPDGSAPNNWVSSFGGAAWTFDPATGQSFLHNHLSEQPDLNWWNDEVREAFDEILRFWADRGVAGFRIDVCNVIIKDAQLRDNPVATEEDDFESQMFGQRSVYNANRPEVHEVVRRWRVLADTYAEPRVLIGETPVPVDKLAQFYGNGHDELHLAFNFNFISAPLDAAAMRTIVQSTEEALPAGAWPAWTGSNHDMFRFPTRWAGDDPRKARTALLMLLMLRGTPVLFQGDEIGMGDATLAQEDLRDPLGVRYWPYYAGRDAARTPMQWSDAPGGGFTSADVTPWLPLGDLTAANVEAQRPDHDSMLHLARDLISLRRSAPELVLGDYRSLPAPEGVWCFARGERHAVTLNLSEESAEIPLSGQVCIATTRSRDGEVVAGTLTLAPWEAAVVRTEDPPATAP